MNAHDMRALIVEAEQEILRDAGNLISERLNELFERTGLSLGGLSIRFIEVSTVESPYRVTATNVDIDARLPER